MASVTLEKFRRHTVSQAPPLLHWREVREVARRVQNFPAVKEVTERDGNVLVSLHYNDPDVIARLPKVLRNVAIVVECGGPGGGLPGPMLRELRHLTGQDVQEMGVLSGLLGRGPDPETLYRMYTILPADLTTLQTSQNDTIEDWLASYPMPLLQTRLGELNRELDRALSDDNQTAIRNAQVKMRHVTNAIAIQDRRARSVEESALSRHRSLAKKYEVTANRLAGRGHNDSAEEFRRRSSYHKEVFRSLRKRT